MFRGTCAHGVPEQDRYLYPKYAVRATNIIHVWAGETKETRKYRKNKNTIKPPFDPRDGRCTVDEDFVVYRYTRRKTISSIGVLFIK